MEKSHGWTQLDTVAGPMGTACKRFVKGETRVMVAQEPHGAKMRWHLSISCQNRYPTWEEIKDARYTLLPAGLTFAQILPPLTEYVNIHSNCFHLWEIDQHEW